MIKSTVRVGNLPTVFVKQVFRERRTYSRLPTPASREIYDFGDKLPLDSDN